MSLFAADRKKKSLTLKIVAWGLPGLLVAQLFTLQVLRSSEWSLASQSNRLRPFTIPASRGAITDRNGLVLADNAPVYRIAIVPTSRDSVRASLARLEEFVRFDPKELARARQELEGNALRPITVQSAAPFEQVAAVRERASIFPRVFVETWPERRYPSGSMAAHALGYMGEISQAEIELPEYAFLDRGARVGRTGVEGAYDVRIRGVNGVGYREVDARGRVVGLVSTLDRRDPVPGRTVETSLDLELMRWIDGIFPEGARGAMVVMEVSSGDVLAMYSNPSFDPAVFSRPVSESDWTALRNDPDRPLLNRAINGQYPPGSPWKLVTAVLGLNSGLVSKDELMPVPCDGTFEYGGRVYRCWNEDGHGALNLVQALQRSCNVYFYQLGLRIGLQGTLDRIHDAGLVDRAGIEIAGESLPVFPKDLGFWTQRFGYSPTEHEVISISIGQGPNTTTPLKMAQLMVALARDGRGIEPRVGGHDRERSTLDLSASEETLNTVLEGMRRVMEPGGTAHGSALEHFQLWGKTGSAQATGSDVTHSWFTGLAGERGGAPEIAVVALVEHAGGGSQVAAPLAAKAADHYLRREHGIPLDTIQTLNEYARAGRDTRWAWRTGAEEAAEEAAVSGAGAPPETPETGN